MMSFYYELKFSSFIPSSAMLNTKFSVTPVSSLTPGLKRGGKLTTPQGFTEAPKQNSISTLNSYHSDDTTSFFLSLRSDYSLQVPKYGDLIDPSYVSGECTNE